MASPNEIRKGRVIVYQGSPHLVLEMLHRTQGRQAGFVQTTLRNLQSGSTTTTKFRSTDSVDILHTTMKKLEFSYVDTDGYHFMDIETYEDTVFGDDMVGDEKQYLVEGNSYDILFVDGQAVKLELPVAVETTVIEAPEGIRGDTASNVQKPVTIDSGLVVQVPLFIKKGEKIRISTTDGSYLGRASSN
ncbi:MAG: elongation factor P [Opitutales bacterium]|jgi:elongation factor P